MGFTGGVSATQLDVNTMQIVARGNLNTRRATIYNYARLKAAEETIAHGFDVFEIIESLDTSEAGSRELSPYYSVPGTRPGETLLIKMFKGPRPEGASANYFDAQEAKQSITAAIARDSIIVDEAARQPTPEEAYNQQVDQINRCVIAAAKARKPPDCGPPPVKPQSMQ
jgi:hypothetical protein